MRYIRGAHENISGKENQMERKDYTDSLRKIADLFENNDIPLPHDAELFRLFTAHNKQDAVKVIKALGHCKKEYDKAFQGSFELVKKIGSIEFRAVFSRESICERRVVGKKEVPARLIPARKEEYIPAHEEEVYEWHCFEPILGQEENHER